MLMKVPSQEEQRVRVQIKLHEKTHFLLLILFSGVTCSAALCFYL